MPRTRDSLLGKMLRIDVNVPDDDSRGYRVPDDNPFVDGDRSARSPRSGRLVSATRGATASTTGRAAGTVSADDRRRRAERARRDQLRTRRARRTKLRLAPARRTEPFDTRDAASVPAADRAHPRLRPGHRRFDNRRADLSRGGARSESERPLLFTATSSAADCFRSACSWIQPVAKPVRTTSGNTPKALGAGRALGMISSFGADHDGELLVLNYARGSIVRIVPDFSAVPRPPQLTAEFDDTRLLCDLDAGRGGRGSPSLTALERVRNGARDGPDASRRECGRSRGHDWRVRAGARRGSDGLSGPPSVRVCYSVGPGSESPQFAMLS